MDFDIKYNEKTGSYYIATPNLIEKALAERARNDEFWARRDKIRAEWEAMDASQHKVYNDNWLKYLNECLQAQ